MEGPRSVRVKICGITRGDDLEAAAAAGADAVGFVFDVPSSPRNLSLERARELLARIPPFVVDVIVTIPRDLEVLRRLYEDLRPSAIQVHGDLLPCKADLRAAVPDVALIRTVPAGPHAPRAAMEAAKASDAILLDSVVSGKSGGTGVVHDWGLSRQVRDAIEPVPLILAGGLNPENVGEAIRTVRPYAVDVSTGVERFPGVKDPEKVRAFVKRAKEAIP